MSRTYGKNLVNASVTGYGIRLNARKDIGIEALEAAMCGGLAAVDDERPIRRGGVAERLNAAVLKFFGHVLPRSLK
jgi:hypothetical protein